MAIANFGSVANVLCHTLHANIKNELRRKFVEMVTEDIEPILEEYTKQIVVQVENLPSFDTLYDIKLNVQFKLPNPPEIKNGNKE